MNQALFFISRLHLRLFVLLYGLITFSANAQFSISGYNLSYKYDPSAEISFDYNLEIVNDSLQLKVNLTIHQDKANIDDYLLDFYQVTSYGQKLENPVSQLDIDSVFIGKKGKQHFILFKFPNELDQRLLAVQIVSKFTGFKYYFDIPLFDNIPFSISTDTQTPAVSSWLIPGRYQLSSSRPAFCFYYNYEFPPATPAMTLANSSISKGMTTDSTFVVTNQSSFILKNPGLYLFQNDTSSSKALAVRVEDKYFPKPAKLDKLVDPLIYITTKNEKKFLEAARENKTKFDKFWIDLTRSSERARDIIKDYYDRVAEANEFFTTYKEGWKTDKGMIYIVFGPPDQVFKTNNEERWVYFGNTNTNRQNLEFKFVRARSIFSDTHYVLIRDAKYTDIWYKTIKLIRQGRF